HKEDSAFMTLQDENIVSDFAIEKMGYNENDEYAPQATVIGLDNKDFKKFAKELNLNYNTVKDKIMFNDYSNIYQEDGTTIRGRTYNYKKGDTLKGELNGEKFELEIAEITDKMP